MDARCLSQDDLLVPVQMLSGPELAELMAQQDVILSF